MVLAHVSRVSAGCRLRLTEVGIQRGDQPLWRVPGIITTGRIHVGAGAPVRSCGYQRHIKDKLNVCRARLVPN